jgi:perosamine synthetase
MPAGNCSRAFPGIQWEVQEDRQSFAQKQTFFSESIKKGEIRMKIPLSRPDITQKEINAVNGVLNKPHLSLGPKLAEFEEKFADYIGSKYALAVNSGTSGLHLCVRALDIKDGDLVITTPFSFISSANCLLFEKAEPFFVDVDEKTLNMDNHKLRNKLKKVKAGKDRLKAVLPVHIFGRPCEMDDILSMAKDYDLKVIEDAAEAVGAEYKDNKENWKKVGTFGDCGIFGFYPNKQMTTGEGGMIVTDHKRIYQLCKSMRNQGRSEKSKWLQHERLGYNYRLSDLNCALGTAQLERINEMLKKRERIANYYNDRLGKIEEIIIPQFEENKKISWFVYVVRLKDEFSQRDRNYVLKELRQKGIGCSDYFTPIHLQPFYRKMFGYKKGDFPVTEKVSQRTLALPFYNNLKEEQVDTVCENLIRIIRSI